ncbi:MAG: CRISPR system precrRNA processing endoribonuclease RAMP protein Cas6, partial [Candidatus Promineifilaceae bacterium]
RRVFQALGRFAAYSGVGRNTTMGMGHCDFRRSIPKPK